LFWKYGLLTLTLHTSSSAGLGEDRMKSQLHGDDMALTACRSDW